MARMPPRARPPEQRSGLARGAFVGRAREMQALDRLAGEGARLVTLLGVAGVGKTRLALEWARGGQAGASFAFCALEEARTIDDACAALARALGVALAAQATTDETVAQLGRALAELDHAVLVLHNLEQLAPLAGAMIEPWLALAPRAARARGDARRGAPRGAGPPRPAPVDVVARSTRCGRTWAASSPSSASDRGWRPR